MLEFFDSGSDQNVLFQKVSFKKTQNKVLRHFGEFCFSSSFSCYISLELFFVQSEKPLFFLTLPRLRNQHNVFNDPVASFGLLIHV